MSNKSQVPAFLSLPTDKPFRITFDVTPVYEIISMDIFGEGFKRRTGPHSYDVSITVEEREEVSHE